MMHSRAWCVCLLLTGGIATTLLQAQPPAVPKRPAPDGAALAAQVKQIFRAHCFECHGGSRVSAGVKVLDLDSLVKRLKKVVPGNPDGSALFQAITASDENVMPPTGQPRLSADDSETVRRWIVAGAPAFPPDLAPPAEKDKAAAFKDVVGVDHVLKAVLAHVRSLPREDRRFVRYFSINHVLAGGATAADLDLQRQALAKALNHLTWEKDIVRPKAIDEPTNTVFAIDLRQLGWHTQPFERRHAGKAVGKSPLNLFDLALLDYPYAIFHEGTDTFDHLIEDYVIPARLARPIVYVRADWFVSVVTQPPLYEDFLRLPFTIGELEAKLGVDVAGNLDNGIAKRAGMTMSGVSRNNRVVERHPTDQGGYWKSYDFRTSKGRENMFQGPIDLHPFGGEMIFALPNGLQGYFVTDARGHRVEAAPTEVVTDRFAEDRTVRNGLACIRCHDQGMKGFVDNVRPALLKLPGSPGFDKRQALRLYPEQAEMDRWLKEDGDRFADAMRKVWGAAPAREPLVPVSKRFLEDPLHLSTVAGELGYADTAGLATLFKSPRFSALGLVPLAASGVVRRDSWEDYQDQVVRDLGLGVPVVPLDGVLRRDYPATAPPFEVELKTNKKSNVFEPGDEMVVFAVNKSDRPIYIELVGTSAQGRKVLLTRGTTRVDAGKSYRYPPAGALKVRGGLGKEQITMLAGLSAFPDGELLRGTGVTDRIVHPFYAVRMKDSRPELLHDPARLVRRTIDVETR